MRSRKELLRSGFRFSKTQGQREGQGFLGKLEAGASSLAPDNQSNPSFVASDSVSIRQLRRHPRKRELQKLKTGQQKKKKKSPGPRLPGAGDTGTAESRPQRPPASHRGPEAAARWEPVHLPPRTPAPGKQAQPRALAEGPRGLWRRRKDPCPQRGVTPPPCQLQATPEPPGTPGHPRPILGHLTYLQTLPSQPRSTSGPSPGCGRGRACAAGPPRLATLPRKARGLTVPGAGAAPGGRQGRGGAQGQGRPGLLTEAPRRRRLPGSGRRRPMASSAIAVALRRKGARHRGQAPQTRRSPPSPPRRAGPPHPRRTSSPPFLPLWVLSGAGPAVC